MVLLSLRHAVLQVRIELPQVRRIPWSLGQLRLRSWGLGQSVGECLSPEFVGLRSQSDRFCEFDASNAWDSSRERQEGPVFAKFEKSSRSALGCCGCPHRVVCPSSPLRLLDHRFTFAVD